jgi:hypothetical protein
LKAVRVLVAFAASERASSFLKQVDNNQNANLPTAATKDLDLISGTDRAASTRAETTLIEDEATASDKNSPVDAVSNLHSETIVGADSTAGPVVKNTFSVAAEVDTTVHGDVDVKVQFAVVIQQRQTVRMNPCCAAAKQWQPPKRREKTNQVTLVRFQTFPVPFVQT